jgi:hypothetical protein
MKCSFYSFLGEGNLGELRGGGGGGDGGRVRGPTATQGRTPLGFMSIILC